MKYKKGREKHDTGNALLTAPTVETTVAICTNGWDEAGYFKTRRRNGTAFGSVKRCCFTTDNTIGQGVRSEEFGWTYLYRWRERFIKYCMGKWKYDGLAYEWLTATRFERFFFLFYSYLLRGISWWGGRLKLSMGSLRVHTHCLQTKTRGFPKLAYHEVWVLASFFTTKIWIIPFFFFF